MSDEMAKVINLFGEAPQVIRPERIHELWEMEFLRRGQTLTDPVAAESLRAGITVISRLLDGALATELINEEQRDDLRAAIEVGLSAADEYQSLP